MASYIMLMKWTQTGIQQIKEDPERIERLRNIFKSVGGGLLVARVKDADNNVVGLRQQS